MFLLIFYFFIIPRLRYFFNLFLMSDNLFEIDSAMNMIKEDIIRELSESVSKQNNESFLQDLSSSSLTFSDGSMD